eukprot:3070214-Prymnesium_polylepis.1
MNYLHNSAPPGSAGTREGDGHADLGEALCLCQPPIPSCGPSLHAVRPPLRRLRSVRLAYVLAYRCSRRTVDPRSRPSTILRPTYPLLANAAGRSVCLHPSIHPR